MSFFDKLAALEFFKSRATDVYISTDADLLLPEGSSSPHKSTYGSLDTIIGPKSKDSRFTSTPFKVLAALAVVVLVGRAFSTSRRAEEVEEEEIKNLRLRLEAMQQPKFEGYHKIADSSCGGEPVLSAGESDSKLGLHPGCKAIGAPSTSTDLALHGKINASTGLDRIANLLDGTDSEWWTPEDSADLTVDVLREAHVTQLRLQWWGNSFADEVNVSVSLDGNIWKQVHKAYNYVDQAEDCEKRLSRGDCFLQPDESKKMCQRTCFQHEQDRQAAHQKISEASAGSFTTESRPADTPINGKLASVVPTLNSWMELSGWPAKTRYVKIELAHGHDDPWQLHERLGLRRIEVLGTAAWQPCAEPGQQCKCFGSVRIWQASTKSWVSKGSSGSMSCTGAAFGINLSRNTGECQCWPAATEEQALEQCRSQCDGLGEQCSAFEYSYITNIHQQRLGPRCCFRSQLGDASPSRVVRSNDCYRKDS